MNGNGALALELAVKGLGLEARLINKSGTGEWVVKDSDLQPSRLVLVSSAGQAAEAFDERKRRKFDNSVSNASYAEAPANGNLVLETTQFQKSGAVYELLWGPFRFGDLPPGVWKARVTFESKIDWVTKDGKEVPASHRVWKGTLTSNEIELKLPA